jgi:2-keto-3-deoxy-L-rhamnonate aldolase RhmA
MGPAASSSPIAGDGPRDAAPGGMTAPLPGLRGRLRSGEPLVATFVMIPRIEIVEMAAGAGFDAVVCDLEHGQVAVEDLPSLHAAARAAGAYSLARVATDRPIDISRALDMGVDGIIVPHVGSRQAAEKVASAGRFPPAGERSLNPYVRGVGYGLSGEDATGPANERSALIAMIEGADALSAVDEIAAVQEIDTLFFGPVDLAGSLGFPAMPEHPEVVATLRAIIQRLARRDIAVGIYAPTSEAARRWLAEGASLVVASADNAMTMRAFAAMRSAIGRLEAAGSLSPGKEDRQDQPMEQAPAVPTR